MTAGPRTDSGADCCHEADACLWSTPGFLKIAPIYREMRRRDDVDPILVHTGQHFDSSMSTEVIAALELPIADVHLDVGPGSQPRQLAKIVTRLEAVYEDVHPDNTVVVGDVNSTLAAALVSDMLGVPVAHVEAGLRSFDSTMPRNATGYSPTSCPTCSLLHRLMPSTTYATRARRRIEFTWSAT